MLWVCELTKFEEIQGQGMLALTHHSNAKFVDTTELTLLLYPPELAVLGHRRCDRCIAIDSSDQQLQFGTNGSKSHSVWRLIQPIWYIQGFLGFLATLSPASFGSSLVVSQFSNFLLPSHLSSLFASSVCIHVLFFAFAFALEVTSSMTNFGF